eukprot:403372202
MTTDLQIISDKTSSQVVENIHQENKSTKTKIVSYLATFAVGMITSQAILQTASNSNMAQSKFLQNLWSYNHESNFTRNHTADLQINATESRFIDLFVSPRGDIYGVQRFKVPGDKIYRTYQYNPNGDRRIRHEEQDLIKMNNQTEVILSNIHDIAALSNGTIYAIPMYEYNSFQPLRNQSNYTNSLNSTNSTDVIYISSEFYKVVIYQNNPVLLSLNNSLFGFYDQWTNVSDISVASDGSVWGLDANISSDYNYNANLLKWNNETGNFEVVESGIRGHRIEAYNEISVAINNNEGDIFYSILGDCQNHMQNFNSYSQGHYHFGSIFSEDDDQIDSTFQYARII